MKFESEYKDKDGRIVVLGDILSSPSTHDVVVMWNDKENDFYVAVYPELDIMFSLKEFIESWHGLYVSSNVCVIKNK